MKILAVTPMYAPPVGGAELHLPEALRRLARRGHEVESQHAALWLKLDGGLAVHLTDGSRLCGDVYSPSRGL
jgi:hypothetical protein